MRVQVRRIPLKDLGNAEHAARAFAEEHREKFLPGLGDVIAGATKAVGIKPCGKCQQRQAALNRATPSYVRRVLAWAKKFPVPGRK